MADPQSGTRRASVFLWFDTEAEDASKFYAETFPDSRIENVVRLQDDVPDTAAGKVQIVEMTLLGLPYVLLNAGPHTTPNDAYSLQVYTEDQTETDRYWDAIVSNGGEESQCGWCKDRWGFSWQITPARLLELNTSPDKAKAKRVFEAMMKMKKIDIASLEAAFRGET